MWQSFAWKNVYSQTIPELNWNKQLGDGTICKLFVKHYGCVYRSKTGHCTVEMNINNKHPSKRVKFNFLLAVFSRAVCLGRSASVNRMSRENSCFSNLLKIPLFFLLFTHSGRWSLKSVFFVESYAVFWVTFVVTPQNKTRIRHSVKKVSYFSRFLLVPRANETLTWRHEGKLNPFFCSVVHGPKERPTFLLSKDTTCEGKIQGQKRFR